MEEAVGHLSQPTPCWAQRRHLSWGDLSAASPQKWSGSRYKSFPHVVLTWNLAVADRNFLGSSCSGPARTKFPSHSLWRRRYRSWKLPLTVRCPSVCTATSPVQWLELPWACWGRVVLGSEGSCWQRVAAAAQEVISVHLSASPRGARMSPFMLSTKAFCFAIWRRVSFQEISPVTLEITHSRVLIACLQTGIWGARPTLWSDCIVSTIHSTFSQLKYRELKQVLL